MGPLTSPNAFFRRESEEPRLLPPVGIVLINALLGVATTYLVFTAVTGSIESSGAVSSGLAIITYASMVFAFVSAFVMWVIFAGLFYVLSLIFDGEGSFSDVVKLVGWGYLPSVVSGLLTAVLYVVFLNGPSVDSPQGFTTSAAGLLDGPILLAITVLGILFTLWQGLLFTFAMKHGRNLSLQQAALVVSPVILVSVGFSLFSVVRTLLG